MRYFIRKNPEKLMCNFVKNLLFLSKNSKNGSFKEIVLSSLIYQRIYEKIRDK